MRDRLRTRQRDALAALLKAACDCRDQMCPRVTALADHLIANGVTIASPEGVAREAGLDVERLARAIREVFGGTPPTTYRQAEAIAREYDNG